MKERPLPTRDLPHFFTEIPLFGGAASPLVVLALIMLIGVLDKVTGPELRVYPFYFVPVALGAWVMNGSGTLIASCACALVWAGTNYLAGLQFSHTGMWVGNITMQFAAFSTVGFLIARLRRDVDTLRQLSTTDHLTSLANTRALYERASEEIAHSRRYGRPLTVAYLDLDNFKTVNDRLGHHTGDHVLRTVAGHLRRICREKDVVARLGGDEFVLLFPETTFEEAGLILERLQTSIQSLVREERWPVTVTIGAATFLFPPKEIDAMLRHADDLMYSAKAAGKNRMNLIVVDTELAEGASTRA